MLKRGVVRHVGSRNIMTGELKMKNRITTFVTVFTTVIISQSSVAADCELLVDRKACPGKESEAMKPYEGKNPTTERFSTADVAACEKKAEKASKIIRQDILAQKTVTGKFKGKDLGKSFIDKSDCK